MAKCQTASLASSGRIPTGRCSPPEGLTKGGSRSSSSPSHRCARWSSRQETEKGEADVDKSTCKRDRELLEHGLKTKRSFREAERVA